MSNIRELFALSSSVVRVLEVMEPRLRDEDRRKGDRDSRTSILVSFYPRDLALDPKHFEGGSRRRGYSGMRLQPGLGRDCSETDSDLDPCRVDS